MDNQKAVADGYVFLNVQLPHVAWAAYRGVLVSCPSTGGFVSSWTVSMLRASMLQNAARQIVNREMKLEKVRKQRFPNRISRLEGFYCFLDQESAKRASSLWYGDHFGLNNLAELSLEESQGRDRLDSNWITSGPNAFHSDQWMPRYWEGEPFPGEEPVWETLVQGRVTVLCTGFRQRAYDVVKSYWPESLGWLAIARLGALAGFDIGNIAAFLLEDTEEYTLKYYMDTRDAENEEFLTRLPQLLESGDPVHRADISPHFERGSFGAVPDMREFYMSIPKLDQ